jgi:cardiolipin synthase
VPGKCCCLYGLVGGVVSVGVDLRGNRFAPDPTSLLESKEETLFGYPWWLGALAILGAFALVSALVSLFSSLGRRPGEIVATQVPAVDSQEFLDAISGTVNAPLQSGGRATLLNNGDEFFPAMIDAIRSAQRSVNFFVYIWEPGKASDQMFEALIERARAGVEVRLLFDGLGGMRAPDKDVQRLIDAGGKVSRFRTAALGKLTRFHKRNHRRAVVIDGNVGFTGGAAVGDKWLGNAESPKQWRDSMVRVTGPIATNLQSAFSEPWAYTCGEILVGEEFYGNGQSQDGDTDLRHVLIASSPASEEHPLRLFFMLSFMAARRKLYLSTSYFVPDKHMRNAVMARARAGVDVRILVPNQHTDAKPIRLAGRSYYDDLLSAGVRMYEYQPTMMHCKTAVIDEVWSIVGSANMDVRSKELNQENALGIMDHDFAAQVEQTFLKDLERAHEFTLEEWRKRSMWERVKERFWVLFAEQY